jgi:hypothetical protein
MKIQMFWCVTPSEAVHKKTAHNLLNPEEEDLGTIKKSVILTCRNNPEELNLHQHRCDNLKFRVLQVPRGRWGKWLNARAGGVWDCTMEHSITEEERSL